MDSEYSVVTSWSVPGELEVLGAVGVLLSVMLFNLKHVGRCGVRFGKPSSVRGFAGDRQGKAKPAPGSFPDHRAPVSHYVRFGGG